jgi:glycosyltransferase involved in cell wall biosynthesis
VHAHWLPAGAVALATGKPFVVQLWGTDVALAQRAPAVARWILGRARLAICASRELADAARRLGARETRVIPSGVEIPGRVGEPDEPPRLLYAGRLSPEKGVLVLAEAARGLPLVVAGDGPLRDRFPEALGFVPHDRLLAMYGQASVVVCPSLREGYGVVCAEAMAHGRPVVASGVGGLKDLVVEGETGLLVPPGDPVALRAALVRLLEDADLRRRLGTAARERAGRELSWTSATESTLRAYRDALGYPSSS